MVRKLALAFALTAVVASAAQAQTVVIVRHGEKADGGSDPDLSAAGQARALALAEALKGARVTHVLATPPTRTQQTAAPAARVAMVAVTPISLEGGVPAHVARVAAAARQAPADATVLIVGHSNTVPGIAQALGDSDPQALTDCDYDRMTVIQLGAQPRAIHARYGARTEPCAARP